MTGFWSYDKLQYYFAYEPLTELDRPQRDFVWRLLYMAGYGKKFDFHGSFLSKAEAVKKEKEVGGFIRERKVKGKTRYFVLTVKG